MFISKAGTHDQCAGLLSAIYILSVINLSKIIINFADCVSNSFAMKKYRHLSASQVIFMLTLSFFVCFNASAQTESFKWIRNVEQQNVRDYSEGFSAYYENGKWGFIDRAGLVVVSPEYDEVEDFTNGLCLVKKGGKWGVIGKNGKLVHECEYESISGFDSGVAYAERDMTAFFNFWR